MGVSTYYHRHSRRVTKSRQWRRIRFLALRRDGFQCVKCGARGALEVDHVQPCRTHPELSLDLGNTQSLCKPCHSRKTRIECGFPESPPDHPGRRDWRAALLNVPST